MFNIYERPRGIARYPDTGTYVEEWPMDWFGHCKGGDCACHDKERVGGHFRALAYNAATPQPKTWPDREAVSVEPDPLAFTSIASRALMSVAEFRRTRGVRAGYLRCNKCKNFACDCSVNFIELTNLSGSGTDGH